MASHGTLAYGHDVEAAVANSRLLEWGCELYWRAAALGTPRVLDEQQRAAVIEAVVARSYGIDAPPRAVTMRAITLGVHVLDVLVRPVSEIPEGQGGALVEQIRITPAGSAGGTAITLAKLGAQVQSAGAIGQDELGEMLVSLLARFGVDTQLLVRRADQQTSASVLPIRPDGSRPALHVVGANATYNSADAPWEAIAACTHLHLGAPEFMGGEEAAKILAHAREHGVVTSADLLAPGEQAARHPRLDRARVRAARLPAAQRGAGARLDRGQRSERGLPRADRVGRRLRRRHVWG